MNYFHKQELFEEVHHVIGGRQERLEADVRSGLLKNLSRLDMIPSVSPEMSLAYFGSSEMMGVTVPLLLKMSYPKPFAENSALLPSTGITKVAFVKAYNKDNRVDPFPEADVYIVNMSKANFAYMKEEDLRTLHGKLGELHKKILLYDLREVGYRGCLMVSEDPTFSYNFGTNYELQDVYEYLHHLSGALFPSIRKVIVERYSHIFRELTIKGVPVKSNPAGEWLTSEAGESVSLFLSSTRIEEVYTRLGVTPIKSSSFEYLKITPKQIAFLATIVVLIFIVVIAYWIYKK